MEYNLQQLKKTITELTNTIDKFPQDKRETVLFDEWDLKDVLAHMGGWNIQRTAELTNFVKGKNIPKIKDFDAFNEQSVSKRKSHPWKKVYEEFIKSCKNLIRAFHNIPENLIEEKIWKDKKHTPHTWLEIDLKHLVNHLKEIEKKSLN